MKDYQPGLLSNGAKFVMLFNLIQESLAMEDKILVFRCVSEINRICHWSPMQTEKPQPEG